MQKLVKFLVAMTWLLTVIAAGIAIIISRHYHIYSMDGWQVYRAMGRECHPVWRDYNFGRVKVGDDLDDVIARTNPTTFERNGRWVTLGYQTSGHFTGISATAYDGKMVFACAWSCAWVRLFLDGLTASSTWEDRRVTLGD